MKFEGTVQLNGKTATGIPVPEEVVAALGGGRRPKVLATVAGHTYRSSVGAMNGTFMLSVSAEVREAAGVTAGDTVEVELRLDTEPREVSVPADFAEALARVPEARRFFDGLSYSNRRWHVLQIEGAKSEATRTRRIEKSVALLASGKAR